MPVEFTSNLQLIAVIISEDLSRCFALACCIAYRVTYDSAIVIVGDAAPTTVEYLSKRMSNLGYEMVLTRDATYNQHKLEVYWRIKK